MFIKIIILSFFIMNIRNNPIDTISINVNYTDTKKQYVNEDYNYDDTYSDYHNDYQNEAEDCQMENQVEYIGYNIKDKVVGSQQECADWCREIFACNFWMLQTLDNKCFIKKTIGDKKDNEIMISGSKKCGKVMKCGKKLHSSRIINGKDTLPNEYPWMASIVFHKPSTFETALQEEHCGGVLISKEWILTAAHCLVSTNIEHANQIFITLGEHDRTKDTTNTLKTVAVEFNINPYYRPLLTNKIDEATKYDIALLRLKDPVNWNVYPYIRPVCLPEVETIWTDQEKYWNEKANIIGWGLMRNEKNSATLLGTNLIIYNDTYCTRLMDYDDPEKRISPYQICAGAKEFSKRGSEDSCQNDSGGPLLYLHIPQTGWPRKWQVIGVTSDGIGPLNGGQCGQVGIYVKVSMHLEWIYRIMDNYVINEAP